MTTKIEESLAALQSTTEDLINVVAQMAVRVTTTEEMQEQLAKQQAAQEEQKRRSDTQSNVNKAFTLVFGLILILFIAVGVVIGRVIFNADGISDLQHRTSDQVLCPLYGVLLTSVNPDLDGNGTVTAEEQKAFDARMDTNQDGVVTEAERNRRAELIKPITDGYRILGCIPPLSE